ncbi:hypothetical protein [Pseudarthrobacter sp. NIBRBAC000502770]|uniref:hypothetical protein n=1 Tax=Pseudarthrobacter sp. NIBRBAC000502770 TaxID=2590785 RepID=UPI0011403EEE|nr:hypothetical protein [Pseudarthrobacter sp. NIBRBAC000502770]QDG89092.1 hypothetical protein NIBR502770_11845 [Pseudarthrobacter sp. NIBRBAC000502770]
MKHSSSAAILITAAVLTLTACGAPSAESNSKEVAKDLLARDTAAAAKLMTPEEQQRAHDLTGGEILGNNSKMPPECKLGDPSSAPGENGASIVRIPMTRPERTFTLKMTVTGDNKLVDRVNYE